MGREDRPKPEPDVRALPKVEVPRPHGVPKPDLDKVKVGLDRDLAGGDKRGRESRTNAGRASRLRGSSKSGKTF